VTEPERIEQLLEEVLSALTREQRERFGPALEELRQAWAALRLARTVREDAFEALRLAQRFWEQAEEDYDRAEEHFRRAFELLDALEEDEERGHD
jgi:tetratricopeptide (TPR) repeat protein